MLNIKHTKIQKIKEFSYGFKGITRGGISFDVKKVKYITKYQAL